MFHLIIVDIGRSTMMKIFTPLTVLLFLLNTNALPYQSNTGTSRFDQDVDVVDSLMDRKGIESPSEQIGRETSILVTGGNRDEKLDMTDGKNFMFVLG